MLSTEIVLTGTTLRGKANDVLNESSTEDSFPKFRPQTVRTAVDRAVTASNNDQMCLLLFGVEVMGRE
jgi:hypothetical protein